MGSELIVCGAVRESVGESQGEASECDFALSISRGSNGIGKRRD